MLRRRGLLCRMHMHIKMKKISMCECDCEVLLGWQHHAEEAAWQAEQDAYEYEHGHDDLN